MKTLIEEIEYLKEQLEEAEDESLKNEFAKRLCEKIDFYCGDQP